MLLPATVTPEGLHRQVALIRNELVGRVVGKAGQHLSLIRAKSGADIQVSKSQTTTFANPAVHTEVVLLGQPQSVTLAAQIIHELIVNGEARVSQLDDAPSPIQTPGSKARGPLPPNQPLTGEQQQQQQQQQQTSGKKKQKQEAGKQAAQPVSSPSGVPAPIGSIDTPDALTVTPQSSQPPAHQSGSKKGSAGRLKLAVQS